MKQAGRRSTTFGEPIFVWRLLTRLVHAHRPLAGCQFAVAAVLCCTTVQVSSAIWWSSVGSSKTETIEKRFSKMWLRLKYPNSTHNSTNSSSATCDLIRDFSSVFSVANLWILSCSSLITCCDSSSCLFSASSLSAIAVDRVLTGDWLTTVWK